MKKKTLIVILGALLLAACQTTQAPPIDDAYIWSDSKSETETPGSSQSTPGTPSTPSTSNTPSKVEYISVQDTTVTIKIKR